MTVSLDERLHAHQPAIPGNRWKRLPRRLYRTYTETGRPLYFGQTYRSFTQRLAEHAKTEFGRKWMRYRDPARDRVEWIDGGRPMTRRQANRYEEAAIAEAGGTLANREFNNNRGNDFEARIDTGHPDPTFGRAARRQPTGTRAITTALKVAPWAVIAACAAVIVTAIARGA